jgi:hypothetical protein
MQASALTPPATADGHFSGSTTFGVTLDTGVFRTFLDGVSSTITHARVLIDGTDSTGVIELPSPVLFDQPSIPGTVYRSSQSFQFSVGTPIEINSPQSMSIDLWCVWRKTGTQVYQLPIRPAAWHLPIREGTLIQANVGSRATPGQINIHKRLTLSDTWTLTFSGTTVGGVSSLVMEPQADWEYVRSGPTVTMTKVSGTGQFDSVSLNYATETPEIYVRNWAQRLVELNSSQTGQMKYAIESPSYYGVGGRSGRRFGPITATGANTFTPVARGIFVFVSTPVWDPIEEWPDNSMFPTSISAVRS